MQTIRAEIPRKLLFLINEKSRYKVGYGGRAGAKTWNFARAILLRCMQQQEIVLGLRETQTSIKESVHRTFETQIDELGLRQHFDVQQTRILCPYGGQITYAGLRNDPAAIKSTEGVTIAWVEEAANVSKRSWDFLIPTIRKPGSEIWVSFNPELDTDETYKRFVVTPPPNAIIVKVNYLDNPFVSAETLAEAEHLKAVNTREYEHIWLGHCRSAVEGAIYEAEMRAAEAEGRITKVPYIPTQPVHTFWDLGYGDSTTIWFMQQVGYEYHMIDYEEDRQKGIDHYLKLLQSKGYVYGTDYLPHDASNGQLGIGMSIEQFMRRAGRSVRIVPRTSSVVNDIQACRLKLPQVYFDADKCADGLQKLRRYRWGKNSQDQYKREPEHDDASHGADGFRTFGVGYGPSQLTPPPEPIHEHASTDYGWMG